jgi:SPP1 gp7 family putative phage head morphogenesis protein
MATLNAPLKDAALQFPWLDGAVDFITNMGLATPDSVSRMSDAMARQTFTAQGVNSIQTLAEMKSVLADVIKSGQGARVGAARLNKIASLRGGQAQTIVRTQTKAAYMDQWAKTIQKPAVKAAFGYVKYVATRDGRTRPWHRALDGFVCSVDDPAYKVLLQIQAEHNCRCLLINLTEKQAQRAGIQTQSDLPNIAALRLLAS